MVETKQKKRVILLWPSIIAELGRKLGLSNFFLFINSMKVDKIRMLQKLSHNRRMVEMVAAGGGPSALFCDSVTNNYCFASS